MLASIGGLGSRWVLNSELAHSITPAESRRMDAEPLRETIILSYI